MSMTGGAGARFGGIPKPTGNGGAVNERMWMLEVVQKLEIRL
jgi:hypothetical protein